MIEPHGVEVASLLSRARAAMTKLAESADGSAERRLRHAGDAYGMLRYAHKLSPDNTDVLSLSAYAADELGKTRQAIEALEDCIRIQGPERAGPEVTGRLGTIYLRLGKLDDAIRWLRYALGPIAVSEQRVGRGPPRHRAGGARPDAGRDRRPEQRAAAAGLQLLLTDAVTLVSFALAVHYDRDEQRGAAFEVLDRMQAALQQELGPFVQRSFAELRFAPAEDEYYYQALLYEALGAYTEARAEWSLYAAVPDVPWRHRALEHVRALDALRRPAAATAHPHAKRPVP